jgi:hypothetical protein
MFRFFFWISYMLGLFGCMKNWRLQESAVSWKGKFLLARNCNAALSTRDWPYSAHCFFISSHELYERGGSKYCVLDKKYEFYGKVNLFCLKFWMVYSFSSSSIMCANLMVPRQFICCNTSKGISLIVFFVGYAQYFLSRENKVCWWYIKREKW